MIIVQIMFLNLYEKNLHYIVFLLTMQYLVYKKLILAVSNKFLANGNL